MEIERIENEFTYHPPTPDKIPKWEAIRAKARELAQIISNECPGGHDQDIAIERLNECVFWANAAIARVN